MKKGLLITYYFPPKNSIASLRTYAFAKYLKEYNCDIDVVCPKWEDNLNLPVSFNILHTHEIKNNRNYGHYNNKWKEFLITKVLYKYFRYNFFRDLKKGVFFYKAVERLSTVKIEDYDYVITSYGPLDVLHIGNYIKEKNPAIMWIIDYRDLFSLNQYNNYGIFREYFNRFEKIIVKKSNAFITVSKHLCKEQSKLIKKEGFVVYNGFDNYDLKENDYFIEKLNQIKLPIISHTGSLYEGTRDIEPFLIYFKKEELDKKFSLIFALVNYADEKYVKSTCERLNILNYIIWKSLKYEDSVTLQKKSRFLLLFADMDGKGNGYLTGKFFEYLYTGNKIIYSGAVKNYELYDILIKYNAGVHFEDFDYIHEGNNNSLEINFFHRKNQVARLAGFLKSFKIKTLKNR